MTRLFESTVRSWLVDLLRQHDRHVAGRGRRYVDRVGDWRFDRRQQVLICRVRGSNEVPYRVTLRVPHTRSDRLETGPESPLDGYDATCTCAYSEGGRFLCKHTFAATTRLLELHERHRPAWTKRDRATR